MKDLLGMESKREHSRRWMRLAVLACGLGMAATAAYADGNPQQEVTKPNALPGMRAYVDPATGQFAAPAADAVAADNGGGGNAAQAFAVGNSPVPGGGVTIDLGGRFLHYMKAGRPGEPVGCTAAPLPSAQE